MSDERSKFYYCYSTAVANYLSSCGIFYVAKGFNKNTGSPYTVYERGNRLDAALDGWKSFKNVKREEGETDGRKPDER